MSATSPMPPPIPVAPKKFRAFATRRLTTRRIVAAMLIAIVADGLQILTQWLAWALVPEIIDVVAMILTVWLLGFHVLLLPTFVLELVPVADMLPTWTGCVAAVIALRKNAEREAATTVDIESEVRKSSHPSSTPPPV